MKDAVVHPTMKIIMKKAHLMLPMQMPAKPNGGKKRAAPKRKK